MEVKRQVVWLGIALETALAAAFAGWAWLRSFNERLLPTGPELAAAFLGAVLLLGANIAFFRAAVRIRALRPCIRFVDEVIKPLADILDWRSALIISVFAGIGEELFFRGVLQTELGLIAASALFALLHFGRSIGQHLMIAGIYFLVGLYLGAIYRASGTLAVPVIVHAVYDFGALLYLRLFYGNPGKAHS